MDENTRAIIPDNTGVVEGTLSLDLLVSTGRPGLKRYGGYVYEEWLPELKGRTGVKVYREMSDNDPAIGALMFALSMLVRGVQWTVVEGEQEEGDEEELSEAGQFIKECMDDMDKPWSDFIDEALSFLTYGWAIHEILFKVRRGPEDDDPRYHSQYTDGRLGWRGLPIRGQETLQEWGWDRWGRLQMMTQEVDTGEFLEIAVPGHPFVPLQKAIHFRTTKRKDNPEGRSLLRNAYRPWYFKKELEVVEAIGAERDLTGFPVLRVPPEILATNAPPELKAQRAMWEQVLQQIKRDEREGLILPNKEAGYDIELLSAPGQRQFDINGIIERKNREILWSVLSDFIAIGHESTGSFALNASKIGLFTTAINGFLESMEDEINHQLIYPTLQMNNMLTDEEMPKVKASKVSVRDVQMKVESVAKMGTANLLPYKRQPGVVNALLKELDLPPIKEEDFEEDPEDGLFGGMGGGGFGGQPSATPRLGVPGNQRDSQAQRGVQRDE